MENPSTRPVFFHCRNQAENSPPFWVEWAQVTPTHAELICAIHLIKPTPAWRSEIDDNELLAQWRGFSVAELVEHGEEPVWIAERMNQVLHGREVFSHAPFDCDLLRRVFNAADIEPEFEIHEVHAAKLIADLARLKRIPKAAFRKCKRKAQLRAPEIWPAMALVQMDALLWADIAEPS